MSVRWRVCLFVAEMASFSDSEDGSTGCSPGYSASELSDVFEGNSLKPQGL